MTPPAFPHQMGQDCATSALRGLLEFHGLPLSEAMVFGLGEGLYFWYAELQESPLPVMLGQNVFLEHALCERLKIQMTIHEPRTPSEAEEAFARVRRGIPTIVKADPYHLDYCWRGIPDEQRSHFGEHVVLLTGLEGDQCWVSDIWSEHLERVPLHQVQRARSTQEGYGYLLPRERWYELTMPARWEPVERLLPGALAASSRQMLSMRGPFGISGLRYAARELPRWLQQGAQTQGAAFTHLIEIILLRLENGGLGGCFRPIFFDFLRESAARLDDPALAALTDEFAEPTIGAWGRVVSDLRARARPEGAAREDPGREAAGLGETLSRAAELEEDLCRRLMKMYS